MSMRFLAAPALIAAAFAPAISQAQQSQITIQTQATVMVPPDRGTVPVMIIARGDTEKEARAKLDAEEKRVRGVLAGMGVKPSQISMVTGSGADIEEQVDAATCAGGAADDATREDYAAGQLAADPSTADAAADAAAAESGACDTKYFTGNRMLMVEIASPDQMEALSQKRQSAELVVGRGVYTQSNPAAARQKARDAAMVQAREDADATAASMGYRITGIDRVSTVDAPISMAGMFRFIADMEGSARLRGPEFLLATTSQTVTIDFIAVPK